MPAPLVFISYSHDSPSHSEWVKGLAADLRRNGVDAILDQWDLVPGQETTVFMERIRPADRAICICTPSYVSKANEPKGGVGYERLIVTAELADDLGTKKFIPVLRMGDEVPSFFGKRIYVDFREDDQYDDRLLQLVRELHEIPHPDKPPLGSNPFGSSSGTETATSRSSSAGGQRKKPTSHAIYDLESENF